MGIQCQAEMDNVQFLVFLALQSIFLVNCSTLDQSSNRNHGDWISNVQVVHQSYKIQVDDVFVIKGNAALFHCHVPNFVKDFVHLISWYKDDIALVTPASPKGIERFSLLPNGDLYIRNASFRDIGSYSCELKDQITGKSSKRSLPGQLRVTEPTGPMAPRITYNSNALISVRQATRAQLCCVAQAYPIPTFSWFKEDANGLSIPIQSNDNIELIDGCLILHSTSLVDHGRYTCSASNVAGSEKGTILLNVDVPLTVTLSPTSVTTDLGKSVAFVCSVTSTRPETRLVWLKDGRSLVEMENSDVGEVHYFNRSLKLSTLKLPLVSRESQGTYQCFASNDYETSSASASLRLGDSSPLIVEPLPSEIVSSQGSTVSLKCTVTGSPLPEVTWTLDGTELMVSPSSPSSSLPRRKSKSSSFLSSTSFSNNPRFTIGDYVSSDGVLYSYLNITSIEVIDGGQYKCSAINDVGSAVSSTTLYIPGSPTSRYQSTSNLTLIAGRDALIHCPVIGYPIDFVRWQHREQSLPINHRQKIERLSSKDYRSALFIQNAQKYHDEGEYSCLVRGGSEGQPVRGNLHVTVKVAPLIDSQPLPEIIYANEGIRVKLVCSIIEGDQPLEIRWYKSGQPLRSSLSNILLQSSDDYSLLTFKKITFEDRGNYTCLAVNSVDEASRTTTLIVNVPPKWSIEPSNETTVVSGHRLVINCSSHGFPLPRISWKKSISLPTIINEANRLTNDNTNRSNSNTINNRDMTLNNHNHLYGYNAIIGKIDITADNNNRGIIKKKAANDDKMDHNSIGFNEYHPSDFKDILSSYRHHVHSNGTLVIQEVDKFDAGFYMCQVNNDIGPGLSKVVKLKVLMPPHFDAKFISMASKKDDKTILKCESMGDLPMTIVWQKDKQSINYDLEKRFSLIEKSSDSKEGVLSLLEIYPTTRQDSALFTCQATNDLGTDDTNIQLIVMEKPEMPMILSISDETSRSGLIRWKGSFSGNSPILHYLVEYKVDGPEKDNWTEVKTAKPEVELVLTGLTPVTPYKVRVKAVNALGVSEPSHTASFKTGEEVPGGPPRNVQLEASGAQSLKVKWFPPRKELIYGKIKGYYIGYRVVDTSDSYNYKNVEIDGENIGINSGKTSTSVESVIGSDLKSDSNSSDISELSTYITNLKRRTTYEVIVQAYNSVGTGPRSDEVRMTTLQNSPPTTPHLKYVSSTFDSITIGWTLEDIDVDPTRRDFVLCYKPESSYDWIKKEINQLTVNEYTINGCKCGTKYAIYLIAKNSLGIGEPSKTITVRTKGGAPVSPTSTKHFTLINSTWIQLNLGKWLDSGCPITKFVIKYKSLTNKQWIYLNKSVAQGTKVVTLNSLSPGKQYNLSISASSDAGTTEAEYTFATENSIATTFSSSGAQLRNEFLLSQASTSSTVVFKQYITILLPVIISITMLLILLSIILFCLRHQHFFDGNSNIMDQTSNFDRISCTSAGGLHKSCGDSNSVEGVPMSAYSSVTKFKSLDDQPAQSVSSSYYSSPNRKVPLIHQTSIPMVLKGVGVGHLNKSVNNVSNMNDNSVNRGSNHDYSEPFVQFCNSQRLTSCLSDVFDSTNTFDDDSAHLNAQYASIKKKQAIRPATLFAQYEDKI